MTRFPTFARYFAALQHGQEPYDWQNRLAHQLASGSDWPWHLDVPTGLGKTTAIAIAVYELARQCHEGGQRTAPQRIFHVVDRRTVIDTTAEYAARIANQINDAKKGPLRVVREALATLCGPGDEIAVATSSIHGDSPDDRSWWRSTGCTLISLTSHQFLSRLLFRGYGVSTGLRPIAAGLCAIDRLVLFDEPHLSAQSVHTIMAAERLQAKAVRGLGVPRSRTSLLGATVGSDLIDLGDGTFSLEPQRETSAVARKRLLASRQARVHWAGITDAAMEKLLIAAAQEAQKTGVGRIVVFANTVGMAQSIYRKLANGASVNGPLALLTSRFRPADRPDRHNALPSTGTVVTTQTLEVGVDESFDVLITEACPWDTLVQRLGRLNRDGGSERGQATIIAGWDEAEDAPVSRKASNGIYGEDRMQASIRLLHRLQMEASGGTIDLGYDALRSIRKRSDIDFDSLTGTPGRIATLTSAMLPILAQTQPTPDPDVPIDPLITGPDKPSANDVSVAWRDHLDIFSTEVNVPIIADAEFVAVPRSSLSLFLQGKSKATAETHDLVSDIPTSRGAIAEHLDFVHFRVRRSGENGWRMPRSMGEILAAEQVVMKPELGGYDSARGWTGNRTDGGPGLDISAAAALRAFRGIDTNWSSTRVDLVLTKKSLSAISQQLDPAEVHADNLDPEPLRSEFRVLEKQTERGASDDDLDLSMIKEAAEGYTASLVRELMLRNEQDREGTVSAGGPPAQQITVEYCSSNIVVTRIRRLHSFAEGKPHGLDAHQHQTAAWAGGDARAIGLVTELITSLTTAGLYHDEGKRRPEFQRYLGASIEDPETPALAKSGRQLSRSEDRLLRQLSGLEAGWRHEGESVIRVAWLTILVLHLIGSHHGWFRPILRPITGLGSSENLSYPDPLEHADEFAELNRIYGMWGLAYLEAILRLADWRASAFPSDEFEKSNEIDESGEVVPGESANIHVRGVATATALQGLHTHPLTGWFAAVGLLAAAQEDDPHASLRWTTLYGNHEGTPLVPVLDSTVPVAELVERIFTDIQWDEAETLMKMHTRDRSLGVKNQKLQPAENVHGLLIDAEEARNFLVLALASDLARAEAGKVLMPIVPNANIASYPKIALDRVAEQRRVRSAEEALAALSSVTMGFDNDASDGGMDRNQAENPTVNGLGDVMTRQSRSALAPLVLHGISRLGAGPVSGVGVSSKTRTRELVLPVPIQPLTFHKLLALTFVGRGRRTWAWSSVSLQWIYAANLEKLTKYQSFWKGGIQHRY